MENKIKKETSKELSTETLQELELQKVGKLPLTSDYVFKRVFSYDGNESVLKDFLEAILNISIKKIEVKNPELIKTTKEDKKGMLDIKAQINDDTVIDIEMQMQNEYNLDERNTTYRGKLISAQLQEGDDYKRLNKAIVIFILNFNYVKRNSYHSVARMRYDETTEDAYVDMGYEEEEEVASKYVETHYIEIPKFKKKNSGTKEKIDQWMWLLTGEEDKIKMAEKENDEVKKANETLNRISLDPKEREQYESMIQAKFNYETGLRNSYEAGKEEGEKVRTRKRRKNSEEKKEKKSGREEGEKIRKRRRRKSPEKKKEKEKKR